jgi:hypothetical protein
MGYRNFKDLPDEVSAELKDFIDYWVELSNARGCLPSRKDFDMMRTPRQVTRLLMIEPIDDNGKVRLFYRFAGSTHRDMAGRELMNFYLDEVWDPDSYRDAEALFHYLAKSREPHFWSRWVESSGTHFVQFKRVMCPFSDDGKTVDKFIGLWEYGSVVPDDRFLPSEHQHIRQMQGIPFRAERT